MDNLDTAGRPSLFRQAGVSNEFILRSTMVLANSLYLPPVLSGEGESRLIPLPHDEERSGSQEELRYSSPYSSRTYRTERRTTMTDRLTSHGTASNRTAGT